MGHETTSARTVNHTALSLASSFRMASGTSSPSFVDTRSGEGGAGPECDAGVDGSHGLACLSCLPSRLWCAHSAKHTAMIQQPPAMHAMIMPAISPDAKPRDFFFFLEPRGRTSTVGVAVGTGIGACPRVGLRVGPGVGPGVIVGAWV